VSYQRIWLASTVELYDFPDRPMEVRWKGHSLPYRVFAKDQRVSHTAARTADELANRENSRGTVAYKCVERRNVMTSAERNFRIADHPPEMPRLLSGRLAEIVSRFAELWSNKFAQSRTFVR